MLRIKGNFEYNEIDRDILNHGLENFVPSKIFDVHVHCWSEKFSDTDTFHEHDWREYETDLSGHRKAAAVLYPTLGQVAAYAFGVDWHENLNEVTFMVYEQLRAQCRACKLLDVSSTEIENMFYGNAMQLIQQIKTGDCYNG